MNYPIRLKLYEEYKDKLNEAWIELDEEGEETFYKNTKNVLQDFINECKKIIKANDLEITCELNNRQIGGYKRCVTDYPDEGWNTEREQIVQAYKELMVDLLYYNSDEIEYKELTVKEIVMMVEMAEFLIQKIDELLIEKAIKAEQDIKNIFWKLRRAWIEEQKNKEENAEQEDEDPFLIKTLMLQGRTNWHKQQKEKKNTSKQK